MKAKLKAALVSGALLTSSAVNATDYIYNGTALDSNFTFTYSTFYPVPGGQAHYPALTEVTGIFTLPNITVDLGDSLTVNETFDTPVAGPVGDCCFPHDYFDYIIQYGHGRPLGRVIHYNSLLVANTAGDILGFTYDLETYNYTPGSVVQVNLGGDYNVVQLPFPEPATWALMLIGIGGLGVALRSPRRGALAA